MKSVILFSFFLLLLTRVSEAQVVDTAAVRREVDSLLTISTKLWRAGKYQEALPEAQKASDISKQILGEVNIQYAASVHRVASIYTSIGQVEKAEFYYLKAVDIKGKVLGKNDVDYARSLNNLANLYRDKGEFSKSEPLYLEIKKIQENVYGHEHPEYAMTLHNLANQYYLQGYLDRSKLLYEEAKNIQLKSLGSEHPATILTINELANIYGDQGDFVNAEMMLQQIISIQEKKQGKENASYAKSIHDLGMLYMKEGEFSESEQFLLEARHIFERVKGKKSIEYASSINNLASLYSKKGDYNNSEILYLEAIKIKAEIIGKNNPIYANSLLSLGWVYMAKGGYAKAETLYLEAIEILSNTLGKTHPKYASSLSDLATLYMIQGFYDKAKTLYFESKEVFVKLQNEESLEYAAVLNNIGMLYTNMGVFDSAYFFAVETNKIFKKKLGVNHPDYAKSLTNIALAYNIVEDNDKIEALLLEAKEIREKVLGKNTRAYSSSLNELSQFYMGTNRNDLSAKYLIELAEINRILIKRTALYSSEGQMSSFLYKFNSDFFLHFSYSQNFPQANIARTSFNNAIFIKNFLQESVIDRNRLLQSDTTTIRLHNLQKFYSRALSQEYAKPIAERDSLRIAEWEEKANTLEKELVRTVAGYGDLIRQVSWQEVKQQLRPGEAAVELVSYRYFTPAPTDSTMYAALVLLPTDTAPHFIPLFEERQLQALFKRPGLDEQLTVKGLYSSKSELLNLLWKPLEPLLRDAKTIYYSPAGLLHRINPAALLDADKQPLSAGRQWVRVGSTRELVTGRLADRSFARPDDAQNAPTAMVWGGIRYDMDSLGFAAANPLDSSSIATTFGTKDGKFRYMVEDGTPELPGGTRSAGEDGWKPLAGSAREAEQVGELLQKAGFHTEVLADYNASEERFKTIGVKVPSPRILHVATHGFAYPDPKKEAAKILSGAEPTYKLQDDPMLRSGLLLAGANYYWKNKHPLENREDGVLVAYEVRDLNLRNTELAVLSACQTGLGDVVGSEGVYGLQRAFRIAGAKFLIVSLWQIPDTQTQELMQLFYENWAGKRESLRDAFNHAQTALREREPNPFMWAGFVLIE